MQSGREQDRDAGKTAGESKPDDRRWSRRDAAPPREKGNIDRDRRDDDGRETGRNVLLGQRDAAVAAEQKTTADDQRRAPIRQRCLGRASPASNRIQQEAGEEKP